jgi:hypothetical protein
MPCGGRAIGSSGSSSTAVAPGWPRPCSSAAARKSPPSRPRPSSRPGPCTSSHAADKPAKPFVFTWRDLEPQRRYHEAVEILNELYTGKPVPATIIAGRLGMQWKATYDLLARAGRYGLAKALNGRGWVPVEKTTDVVE